MKRIILTTLLEIIILQCLTGCGVNTEKTATNNTTQIVTTSGSPKGHDNIPKELYAKVYDAYFGSLSSYLEWKIDGNHDLDNDCVAIKDIFAEEYPELITLSSYHYSKKGYIKHDVAFTIETYRESKTMESNIKILYADYKFIQSGEKAKGYAVLLKKDGTIVLHKSSDTSSEYRLLEKDGDDRFLGCKTISVKEGQFLIDDEAVSQEAAASNIATLLNDLDCILIKDGSVSEEVEQSSKNLSSIQLNPHDAKVYCLSKSAEYSSEEIDKKTMWSEFAGTYSSDCGVEEENIEITIKSDGSFVGEYKSLPVKVNKTVDGKNIKKSMDYAKFHGTFSNARKLNDIEYYIECNDFSYVDDTEYEVKEDVLYNYCEPYPLRTFSQFIIYKKGSKLDTVPEYIEWWYGIYSFYQKTEVPDKLDKNVLRNIYIDDSDISFVFQQDKTKESN